MNELKKENEGLKEQVSILQDLQNIDQESYYRQQMLELLERIALSLEKNLKEEEND